MSESLSSWASPSPESRTVGNRVASPSTTPLAPLSYPSSPYRATGYGNASRLGFLLRTSARRLYVGSGTRESAKAAAEAYGGGRRDGGGGDVGGNVDCRGKFKKDGGGQSSVAESGPSSVDFDSDDGSTSDSEDATEVPHSFPPCRSIDEAMHALHTLLSEAGRSPYDESAPVDEDSGGDSNDDSDCYDWILDGSLSSVSDSDGRCSSRSGSGDSGGSGSGGSGSGVGTDVGVPGGGDGVTELMARGRRGRRTTYGQDVALDTSLANLELEDSILVLDHADGAGRRHIGGLLMMAGACDARVWTESWDDDSDGEPDGRINRGVTARPCRPLQVQEDTGGSGEVPTFLEVEDDHDNFGDFVLASDAGGRGAPAGDGGIEGDDDSFGEFVSASPVNSSGGVKSRIICSTGLGPMSQIGPVPASGQYQGQVDAPPPSGTVLATEILQCKDPEGQPDLPPLTVEASFGLNGSGSSVSSDVSSSCSESSGETNTNDREDEISSDGFGRLDGCSIVNGGIWAQSERTLTLQERLLSRMPLADVSCPEGRFARRTQLGLLACGVLPTDNDVGKERVAGDEDLAWWREESADDVEGQINPNFFKKNYDPVLEVLKSVPWYHSREPSQDFLLGRPSAADEIGGDHMIAIEDFLIRRLSELDEAHRDVTTILVREIKKKSCSIAEGMRRVQDIDLDIARGHMLAAEGAKYLTRARDIADHADRMGKGEEEKAVDTDNDCLPRAGAGILGGLDVLLYADSRDQLRSLLNVLDRCTDVIGKITDLNEALSSSSVSDVVDFLPMIRTAAQLCEKLEADRELSRLLCLQDLRDRVEAMPGLIALRIDNSLGAGLSKWCCSISKGQDSDFRGKFDGRRYGTLLKARLALSQCCKPEASVNKVYSPSGDGGLVKVATQWSSCILRTLEFEMEKAVAWALLDPMDEADGKEEDTDDCNCEEEYDADLFNMRVQLGGIQLSDENASSDLKSLRHNLLTVRFNFQSEANHLPGVYRKLCALLAEILHVQYLISRWHLSPFEEHNEDDAFLESDVYHREKVRDSLECEEGQTNITRPNEQNKGHDQKEDVNNLLPIAVASHVACDNDLCCPVIPDPSNAATSQEKANMATLLSRINDNIVASRVKLWQCCESVLVGVLEQYLQHLVKKKSTDGGNSGGLKWAVDLQGLSNILWLSELIITIGREFLLPDVANENKLMSILCREGQCTGLGKALTNVFRKHLRGVHIEAMNVMGALLSNETWHLVPIEINKDSTHLMDKIESLRSGHNVRRSIEQILQGSCPLLADSNECCNRKNLLFQFVSVGNPFLHLNCTGPTIYSRDASGSNNKERVKDASRSESSIVVSSGTENCPDSKTPERPTNIHHDPYSEAEEDGLYSVIFPLISYEPNGLCILPLGTQSAVNGLVKWTARLLAVIKKLPIIASDVAKVLANIYDLYLLTVFRLCAGNSTNESILLGLEERCPMGSIKPEQDQHSNGSVRPQGGYGFRQRKRRPPPKPTTSHPISPTIEADICAPLPAEKEKLEFLRKFIVDGQESVRGMVNLDRIEEWGASIPTDDSSPKKNQRMADEMAQSVRLLEKNCVASCSSLFAAALLDTAWAVAKKSMNGEQQFVDSNLTCLKNYVSSAIKAAPMLMHLATRMTSIRSINARNVVHEVSPHKDI